ncbi:MAG: hypothetical protein KJ787_14060 [Gammaproteobacteria bacterium]|nr:hypothetical protein [Gammaproteobacteria bacterium]MBU1647452.1 hypothetical protein [Gammaproteobacteria bacterium]MBU1973244.1 hypothetical protein [Gammaproteobacteria bacterium]
MSTTKKAVRVIWADSSGGGDCTLDYDAPHTAEAICRALDDMEAAGIDLMRCENFAIVAKSGPGAATMLSLGYERRDARCAA